jgi:glutamate-1-semialdehyde 2,1-aminomutase
VAVAPSNRGTEIDRRRIDELTEREYRRFLEERPRSAELLARGRGSMPSGVPMAWMNQLFGHPPVFMDRGEGAYVIDVDGNRYLDTNIADTSMFCGYSPEPVIRAVRERIGLGPQFLMPTEDAIVASEALAGRWPVAKWQFTLSATFANTEAIRVARAKTGRSKLLMFGGKYHGHADEMLVAERDGRVVPEYRGLRPSVTEETVLVDFNDVPALERALAADDVACVVTEPALTNVGVILPDPGFHASLRELTRAHGTLLVIDETHTLICGPGGLTRSWDLEPDIVTVGKSIGGGIPVGAYGMTPEVADALDADADSPVAGHDDASIFGDEIATGGTLFGNALQMAAVRTCLTEVLTDEAYDRASRLGEKLADGIDRAASAAGLPWCAHRLVARSGYAFDGVLPRNAREARASHDGELYRLLRLYMANRGVWEAMEWAGPAVSIAASDGDIATYLEILGSFVAELVA